MEYPINIKQIELSKQKQEAVEARDKHVQEMEVVRQTIGAKSDTYQLAWNKLQSMNAGITKINVALMKEHYREADIMTDIMKQSLGDERLQKVYNEVQRRLNGEEQQIIEL